MVGRILGDEEESLLFENVVWGYSRAVWDVADDVCDVFEAEGTLFIMRDIRLFLHLRSLNYNYAYMQFCKSNSAPQLRKTQDKFVKEFQLHNYFQCKFLL